MRRAFALSSFFFGYGFEPSADGGEVRANAGKITARIFAEEEMKIVYSVAVPVILLGMLVEEQRAR